MNIHKIPIKYQENTKKFGTENPIPIWFWYFLGIPNFWLPIYITNWDHHASSATHGYQPTGNRGLVRNRQTLFVRIVFFSIEKQPETVSTVTSVGSYRDHQLLSQRSTKTQATKTHEVPNVK